MYMILRFFWFSDVLLEVLRGVFGVKMAFWGELGKGKSGQF